MGGCGATQSDDTAAVWDAQRVAAWDAVDAGEVEGGLAALRALCAQRRFGRACYDRALLLFRLGREPEAVDACIAFVSRFPDHALVSPALRHLVRYWEQRGDADAGYRRLTALASQLEGTDAWAPALYYGASLAEAAGRHAEAQQLLVRIADLGRWHSPLWNDAVWRLAQKARERGDRDAERRWLERLTAAKEESRLIGSYHFDALDDALLRLGTVYRESGRADDAARVWRQLAHWKTSRLRDDAMLALARLDADRGDVRGACRWLRRILRIDAASKRREAVRRLDAWHCDDR